MIFIFSYFFSQEESKKYNLLSNSKKKLIKDQTDQKPNTAQKYIKNS